MSNFANIAQSHLQSLDQNLGQFKLFQNLESKTKVPRSYWTSSSVFFYLLLTFLNVGGIGQILSNFIGFMIPTINSVKALKTKDDHSDDQFWLSYWIIFGFLNIIEFWSSTILYLIPFYWVLKLVFLLYISIPTTGGCQWVYNKLIEPTYDQLVKKLVIIGNNGNTGSVASSSSNQDIGDDVRQAVKNTAAKATGASRHSRH